LTLGDLDPAQQAINDAIRYADSQTDTEKEVVRVWDNIHHTVKLGMKPVIQLPGLEPQVWQQIQNLVAELRIVRAIARTFQARVAHLRGNIAEAGDLFREAEKLQATDEFPFLYSLSGYYYCDWLMDQERVAEVRVRASKAFESAKSQGIQLDMGLAQLMMGHVAMHENAREPSDLRPALLLVENAMDLLVTSGQQEERALALITLARVRREMQEYDEARRCLDRVLQLTQHFKMAVLEVDAELERARLLIGMQLYSGAREVIEVTRAKVAEIGYHRREADILGLHRMLRGASG
jgi:tetratricopeptide (TPR) repeat protein